MEVVLVRNARHSHYIAVNDELFQAHLAFSQSRVEQFWLVFDYILSDLYLWWLLFRPPSILVSITSTTKQTDVELISTLLNVVETTNQKSCMSYLETCY